MLSDAMSSRPQAVFVYKCSRRKESLFSKLSPQGLSQTTLSEVLL